ncbi:hypothetical protein BC332_34644 [Capsicum chinense]|nr:hypothetical protein BC332_34644 [Capsicum chinense]
MDEIANTGEYNNDEVRAHQSRWEAGQGFLREEATLERSVEIWGDMQQILDQHVAENCGGPEPFAPMNYILLALVGNDVFIDEALISFEPEAPQEAPNSTLQKKSAETKQNAEVEEKFWSRNLAKPEEFNSLPVKNVQELLIKIFGDPKIQQLFKDTVTRKSKVWELVAESLQKAGYPLPQKGPRSTGKQCDDKWRQMKVSDSF